MGASVSRVPESEEKSGTFSRNSAGPDSPFVPDNDSAYGGQSDAGAFEFSRTVQALEGAKQLAGVGHVKSGAVVADKKYRLPVRLKLPPDVDDRSRVLAGELPGIADQI